MFSPEERRRAVDLYSATPMTMAQVVEHLGYPTRRCPERWLAKDPGYAGHMTKPIIPLETRAKAIEPVPGGMRRKRAAERLGAGVGAVHNRVKAYREGGMAVLRPENRNAGQADKPAPRRDRDACDAEAPRRRVEELEPGNAVMREVVEARRKRPGRRPATPVGQGEDAAGRPSAPDVFARPDDMLARHRAGQPPTAATPGSGSTNTPGRVSGRPRRSPLPRAGTGTAGSRPCSGPASRRRRPAGSWPRMVRRRMFPNDTGTAHTRARPRRLPATSPTAISRLGYRTGNGPRTSPGIKAGDGKGVPLAAGRLPRRQDRRVHGRLVPTPGSPTGCSSRPRRHCRRGHIPWCIPTADGHCRWTGWLALMDRYGLTRSTGAKGRSPDDAAAEGFFGRMRTESVHPEHWEERTRSEALVPVDDCIRWHDHERIRRPLGWMSPVRYRQSQGMAA